MFNRKIKEAQSLIDSSRKALKKSEAKVEILTEENVALYEENKSLRFEIEELKDIFEKIEKAIKEQNFNSVKNLENKIESILKTAKSI